MPKRPELDPSLPVTESPAPAPCMNGTALKKYDPTLNALTEAKRVDEVKDIRDKAVAMEKYAREAKNTDLIDQAVETRLCAERRAGEILAEMMQRGERDNGKGNRNPALKSQTATPKLADMGITRSQSSRWQHLASLSEGEFESKVEHARWKALRAIDGKRKPVRAKRRAKGHADRNNVLKAVKMLCDASSAEKDATVSVGSLHDLDAADLGSAIAFLQKLQQALRPAERCQ